MATSPIRSAGVFVIAILASSAGAQDAPRAAPAATKDAAAEAKPKPKTLGIVLYEKFELLDVYGPAEIFGNVPKDKLRLVMIADKAGPVASTQGPKVVADFSLDDCPPLDYVLVPGGIGTLRQLSNQRLLDWLRERAKSAEIMMSVCSGSAILAKAGLLDGRKATSNKQSFKLITAQGKKVEWVKEARWVDDGNRVTSSGVSAGIDMALAMVERLYGKELAQRIADGTEYDWHKDPAWDPFAKFVK